MSGRTRHALMLAAERIGANAYARGMAEHRRAGRSARTYRYAPTRGHLDIVNALRADIADDYAMSLLHRADIMRERFA